ncbi:MAG: winged helix-turn-helix transcriptional regulator [Dehalococcoidales bacterium]|nr:winged helix-turn-helix transcriptional regulator [Dehalococcoidales bacterium]
MQPEPFVLLRRALPREIRVITKLVLKPFPLQPWAESGKRQGPERRFGLQTSVQVVEASQRRDEDYEILVLLDSTQQLIHQSRAKELKDFGISPIEASVLSVISDIAPSEVIPAEISRRVFRRPHSILELLKRMEKKGLMASLSEEGCQQLRSCLQILQDRVKDLEEWSREAAIRRLKSK